MKIAGNLVDIHLREIYPAEITVADGVIKSIVRVDSAPDVFIIPGLIDAHIHIESSMVTPGAFAVAAVKHGTTSVVSDPHEIANVLGIEGVNFMIEDSLRVPLKFWFGAPSCVPATDFERSGAVLNSDSVAELLSRDEIKYLSEMMNFPGVIYDNEEVKRKIHSAKKLNKPVDGHAPGLKGNDLRKYVEAGITTDHECSSIEEALEKISLGMKVLIREGSAARNLDSLKELFRTHPDMVMLCSDDLHPEMLEVRHLNKIIASLVCEGYDLFDVIRSATINVSRHYNLNSGLIRKGDAADFIIVDDPKKMNVHETWIDGLKVYAGEKVNFEYSPGKGINRFNCSAVTEDDIAVRTEGKNVRIIEVFEGELLTKQNLVPSWNSSILEAETRNDLLKIVVKDRYTDSPPVVGFIKGFGLKKGAFASSVAHDSHNIIAVGTNNADIISSINKIVEMKGGLAVSSGNMIDSLELNIGGIMTTRSCREVAHDYERLNQLTREYGCMMKAPFMTLSFMALLVIPELKISDRGLFDVNKFQLVSLFV